MTGAEAAPSPDGIPVQGEGADPQSLRRGAQMRPWATIAFATLMNPATFAPAT